MTLIVGSAELSQELLLRYAQQATKIIAADGGLHHLHKAGLEADLILGDFDSYQGELPHGAKLYPKEKDFSDMEAALSHIGEEETVILGATGGRLDHFLSILRLMEGRENICLVDEQNELFYRKGNFSLKKREGYFSLFPLEKTRISITGAKYDLDNREVDGKDSLLLSNEWKEEVTVEVNRGWVLVVLSKDKKNPLRD